VVQGARHRHRHQPVTLEARFRSLAIPCGVYGGQNGIRTGLSSSTSGFPYEYRFQFRAALIPKSWQNVGAFKQSIALSDIGDNSKYM